jgi:hypothetical protein
MTDPQLLDDMLARASRHAGRPATPDDTVAGTLGIGGEAFGTLCDDIEADYALDLRPLFETNRQFHDATIQQLADFVARERSSA